MTGSALWGSWGLYCKVWVCSCTIVKWTRWFILCEVGTLKTIACIPGCLMSCSRVIWTVPRLPLLLHVHAQEQLCSWCWSAALWYYMRSFQKGGEKNLIPYQLCTRALVVSGVLRSSNLWRSKAWLQDASLHNVALYCKAWLNALIPSRQKKKNNTKTTCKLLS